MKKYKYLWLCVCVIVRLDVDFDFGGVVQYFIDMYIRSNCSFKPNYGHIHTVH